MSKYLNFHLLCLTICFWYLCAYILQPFPSCIISLLLIGTISVISFRRPEIGVVSAIFLTPLTLSLGRQLEFFLGEFAPPYLPYAEIILVSTLLGFVCLAVLNRIIPERFPIPVKEKSPFEVVVYWIFGFWLLLTFLGVIPALIRNFRTSPSIPVEIIAVKVLFAPVWGLKDDFFPLTVLIRVFLSFCFVYYIQALIRQEKLFSYAVNCLILGISISAAYGVVQYFFEVGYVKGNYSSYIQGTFHDNESFASFNLFAFMIAFPLYFNVRDRLLKIYYGFISLLLLTSIFLSHSRSILLLSLSIVTLFFVISIFKNVDFILCKKKECFFLIATVSLVISIFYISSPVSFSKLFRLSRDIDVVSNFDFSENKPLSKNDVREATDKGGGISLAARIKLWKSALLMLNDSSGFGMGTGSFYRLTGFPKYQALSVMENAHFYWLQFLSELGFSSVFVILFLLILPCFLGIFCTGIIFDQKWMSLALVSFWFCNVVGQSLLQQELLWLFSIFASVILIGKMSFSHHLKEKQFFSFRKSIIYLFSVVFLVQVVGWCVDISKDEDITLINFSNDTYGYFFDNNGHRYLKVGECLYEQKYVPFDDAVLEIRLCPASSFINDDNPLFVKAMVLDEYNRVVCVESLQLTDPSRIESLFLRFKNNSHQLLSIYISANQLDWSGNLFYSDERKLVGFNYYGNRWKADLSNSDISQ